MRRRNELPRLGRPRPNRLLWLSMLAVLVLGVWPGQVILASTLLSGEVRGEVHLQGRGDNAGVEIQVQSVPGSGDVESFSVSPPVQAMTGSQGAFSMPAQGSAVVTARREGYLDAQKTVDITSDAPLNLGATTLYGGEVTGDNLIDISDLALLGANFTTNDSKSDINGDGTVDILDLSMAAANFLMSGPTPWGE
jgi:hypothetical protein